MTLPILRPGQTHAAVLKLKSAVVRELKKGPHAGVATAIRLDVKTYGPTTVHAVKVFQKGKQLGTDGVVGEKTWRALGFDDKVVDERPPILHGIPFEPGLLAVDGRWVDKPLALEILKQRKAGQWTGMVNSGYRPAWYQKKLWDEAVKKYGSEQAASKWVARPGTSRHGKKGGAGAVDVQMGQQLDDSSSALFRPMDWEAWHVQLAGTREMPGEETGPPDEDTTTEPTAEELEEHGITMSDVDDSVAQLLDRFDQPNDQQSEAEAEAIDEGYDPEAATGTVEEEAKVAT
jgi:D-alanyl-D-alanine carboxypeptidase/Putative peptidoglycan binding domain